MPIHPEDPDGFVPPPAHPPASGSLGALARRAADRGGQRPFVTFYDDASGERTELGHATLHNWVSKAANLLTDEFGLATPATVDLRTPTHWTTLVVLLAAWRCGLTVRFGPGRPAAALTVLPERDAGGVTDPERTLVVGSGLGARLAGDGGGARGFAEEVLACGDDFDDPDTGPGTPALVPPAADPANSTRANRAPMTHGDLLALADATRGTLGLGRGERLLVARPLETLEGLAAVLAALDADASVVLVANAVPEALGARADAERCDVVLGPAGGATRGGGAPAGSW
jgi:uncharacterized protein (TIGR03089 family)